MRVHVCAVGRLRGGPEAALIEDYLTRFGRTGQGLGLGTAQLHEIEDRSGGGAQAEAERLLRAVPGGAVVCALDERGKALSSPEFATMLAGWRDDGRREAAFVIGGADGLAREVRDRADVTISFGRMVWPHMLARVMLTEQLYRAATILAGTPYHRG